MYAILKNQKIALTPEEIKCAKKMVNSFINSVKKKSNDKKVPGLYFTTLIMMNMISGELIEAMTPESLETILGINYRFHKKENPDT